MIHVTGYTIAELLSETYSSVVFRAHRDSDGRQVVIKAVPGRDSNSAETQRLQHEAQVLRLLTDVDGVAHSVELVETTAGAVALVLEWVSGQTLHHFIRTEAAATKQQVDAASAICATSAADSVTNVGVAIEIALAVVRILSQLHERHIVHKDIKPHNIILERLAPDSTKVRLIDFGIALLQGHESSEAIEHEEIVEGTPAYLPPEQTGRIHRVIDWRSDYYALGATLYHLLAKQVPFPDDDAQQVIAAHISRRPQPLHELVPAVPQMLSDVVQKLMSKAAEDRYQSARGLRTDLERCLRELRATGTVTPFKLGGQDRSAAPRPPQRLYGRDLEQQQLWSAFAQTRRGGSELVIITGAAGVGKSALVRELLWSLAPANARVAEAKFEQFGSRAPDQGTRRILESLVQQALALPPRSLQDLKHRLELAFSRDKTGQVLTNLCPDLELLMGPQPPVPALEGEQAHKRQSMLVCELLRTVASATHPLVLFFDDLQWADSASLRTLLQLVSDRECAYLLVIGAYRENELSADNPLPDIVEKMRKASAHAETIELGPLSRESATQLVADALCTQVDDIRDIAQLIERKTDRNPFFISQFLRNIYEKRLLLLDDETGCWRYDLSVLAELVVSDNVVDFLVHQLRNLPLETQRALAMAAAVGHDIDHRMLTSLLGCSTVRTAEVLRPALADDLLIPTKKGYRLLQSARNDDRQEFLNSVQASYRFQHDRIQQAAYTLLPADERVQTHLRIGRALEQQTTSKDPEHIFSVVRHLNLGAQLLRNPQERIALVRLDQQAALLAKSKTAHAMAVDILGTALSLFDDAMRASERELWWDLSLELADCSFRSGQVARAEQLLADLQQHSPGPLQQARIGAIRVEIFQAAGNFAQAVAAGREALQHLGRVLPRDEAQLTAELDAELTHILAELASHPLEELAQRPPLVSPLHLAELDLLMRLDTPAFPVSRTLSALITAKQVSLCLAFGNAPNTAVCYIALAMLLVRMRNQFDIAKRLAELALRLNSQTQSLANEARLRYLYAGFLPFVSPLKEAIFQAQRSFEIGSTFGDMQGYFAELFASYFRFLGGEPIAESLASAKRNNTLIRRTGNSLAIQIQALNIQIFSCLAGTTTAPTSLSDERFDESVELSQERCRAIPTAQLWYYLAKLLLLIIHDEIGTLWETALLAEQAVPAAAGVYIIAEFSFLFCMAGLIHARAQSHAIRTDIIARITPHRDKIKVWAESCPANFSCKRALIDAAWAQLYGDIGNAAQFYEQASLFADKAGFLNYKALSNDLAARMFLLNRSELAASRYLQEAVESYQKWGTRRRANQLTSNHAHLLPLAVGTLMQPKVMSLQTVDRLTTISISGLRIDLLAVMQLTQAIAREVSTAGVIRAFLDGVMLHIGADSCLLLLQMNGALQPHTSCQPSSKGLLQIRELSDGDIVDYPQSVTQFVANSSRVLTVTEAVRDQRFSGDRYIVANKPKSILALPLILKDELLGVVYLENRAIASTFTVVRTELASLLAAQAAIALENARLYERLALAKDIEQQAALAKEEANIALRQAQKELEQQVVVRTEDLQRANDQLRSELVERSRLEQERAALQDQIIHMHQDQLNELSTPLIPVRKDILVLPLMGTMDTERAQRTLDILLAGAAERQARAVIIDITGMRRVDAEAASLLLRAVQALRLLGIRTILSGVRASLAQLIVKAGIDFSSVPTRSTLEDAIAVVTANSPTTQSSRPGTRASAAASSLEKTSNER